MNTEPLREMLTDYILSGHAYLHVRTTEATRFLSELKEMRGFKVVGLPRDSNFAYSYLDDPTSPVWRRVLSEDRSTPVPDQAAFRVDWSGFLRQPSDRARQALSTLAEGHKQVEVADHLGVVPPAVCQRVKKGKREWARLQGEI